MNHFNMWVFWTNAMIADSEIQFPCWVKHSCFVLMVYFTLLTKVLAQLGQNKREQYIRLSELSLVKYTACKQLTLSGSKRSFALLKDKMHNQTKPTRLLSFKILSSFITAVLNLGSFKFNLQSFCSVPLQRFDWLNIITSGLHFC